MYKVEVWHGDILYFLSLRAHSFTLKLPPTHCIHSSQIVNLLSPIKHLLMNIWPQINNEVDSQKNENDVFGRGIMAKMDTGFSLRALELEDNSVIFLLRNLIYNVFFLNKYVTITIFTFNVADISGDLFLCSNHFFFSVTVDLLLLWFCWLWYA